MAQNSMEVSCRLLGRAYNTEADTLVIIQQVTFTFTAPYSVLAIEQSVPYLVTDNAIQIDTKRSAAALAECVSRYGVAPSKAWIDSQSFV